MSRRVAELAEVALGYIVAEKAEVPTALYAEKTSDRFIIDSEGFGCSARVVRGR